MKLSGYLVPVHHWSLDHSTWKKRQRRGRTTCNYVYSIYHLDDCHGSAKQSVRRKADDWAAIATRCLIFNRYDNQNSSPSECSR
ncbi:hypothetical protein VTI28DRAFT_5047 [Corynascus sepedonium]